MTRSLPYVCLLLLALFLLPQFALAGPRDAAAVLNRCGKPLKGDQIILESTVAGGRRVLSYERGTLNFDKVSSLGWTFTYANHRKLAHLNADEMVKYMPCLKDALADSASSEPLVVITPITRVEVSMKRSYKKLVLYTLALLALLGVGFFFLSRKNNDEAA